jgi:hypothetical protein
MLSSRGLLLAAAKETARVFVGPMVMLALTAAGPLRARGAEVTRVVSALDDQNRFDLNLTLGWFHEAKRGFINRELESELSPRGELVKDLEYAQTRDVLDLRADFGVLWDVGLHVEAPLVLSDVRTLDFDQSDSGTSTLLRDGILPGFGAASYGLDAEHGRPFTAPSTNVFRGPVRRGFESLGLGITWAVFNQARDDTKPTWTLGFDAKLDLFRDMRFDPANPGANTAVGLGYHQLVWSTFVSKRFRHFDPYFGAWYMLPVRTNGSIYQELPGGNQTAVNPQQRAGVVAGFEQIAWEDRRGMRRVTIELRGRAEERFFGRSASELWEPLSGRSDCAADGANCRAGIDLDLDGDGRPDHPHPGVTETQAYGTFGGDAGLNVQIGKHVRFRGLFGVTLEMPHFITFANAGVDRNGDNHVDSTQPAEANPVYREAIDLPGRRFKSEGMRTWSLFFEGSIMF